MAHRPALPFMPTNDTAHQTLRDLLYGTFRLQPHPLVVGAHFGVPAATLWTGARTWVNRFRAAGLVPGDRVVMRLPRTPAQIMVTIAAWWEGLTLCPVAPRDRSRHADLLTTFDATLLIDSEPGDHTICPNDAGDASAAHATTMARHACSPPSAGIALIMTTSGSTGTPTRVALSYSNVLHHLSAHTPTMGMSKDDRVLSVLPWNHAFGMLVDLWPSLLSGAMVVVDPGDGRSAANMLRVMDEHEITHLSMVPLQAAALADQPQGMTAIASLRGGIVGGAPISARLAEQISGTPLRSGYGQTEASPGILLGAPGVFCAGSLGVPVGCETRIVEGELQVRGANVCAGFWSEGRLVFEESDRWLQTGDLVESCEAGLRFLGRLDHRFKLDNGRMVDAPSLERRIETLLPGVDAVVSACEGSSLRVSLIWPASGRHVPARHAALAVSRALGSDAHRLSGIVNATDHPDLRTRKGEIDRARLLSTFHSTNTTTPLAA